MEDWATARGWKPLHLKKVYNAYFRNGVGGGGAMMGPAGTLDVEKLVKVDIGRSDAEALLEAFVPCSSRVVNQEESAGGGLKLVVQLASGRLVETVIIRHSHITSGRTRHTVCVSSQVGCAKACNFCATGTMGLQAQLTSSEILEQVWHAREVLSDREVLARRSESDGSSQIESDFTPKLRNVVFMGMGEPMDNYDAVVEAVRGLTHQCLFGFSAKHVTISTVGASAAKIRALADDCPDVCLALSLHGGTQILRERLIPAAKACPLPDLEAALDYHAEKCGQGAMLEYLLIAGVNDGDDDADALAQFCLNRANSAASQQTKAGQKGKKNQAFVNLIPYNPTLAGGSFGFETPSDDRVAAFHSRLRNTHGVSALIRWSSAQGRDTNGACGQLALSVGGVYPQTPAQRNNNKRSSTAQAVPTGN